MITCKLIEATFFVGQNVKLRDDMIVCFDTDLLFVVPKGTELVVKEIDVMEGIFGTDGVTTEAVHYDIYKENDLRMYSVETLESINIPCINDSEPSFEKIAFKVTEDMIKKLKTDKPAKEVKTSFPDITPKDKHLDILKDEAGIPLSKKEKTKAKQALEDDRDDIDEMPKNKKKGKTNNDMPTLWITPEIPDLDSSPNVVKALKMDFGKDRDKALKKARKAAEKAASKKN